jgi:hypothetical protein
MVRILEWTEADLSGLKETWGLSRILTKVGEDGFVTHELGFDGNGNIVHRHPGEPTRAKHGVFDLARIGASSASDMKAEDFDKLW